jgi:hypothetical protein
MTTKRKTQGGAEGKGQLKARARALVADVRRYDFDTRRAVAQGLAEGSKDLARMCSQAEAGEIVETPFAEISEDYRGAAHAALQLLETDAVPDWLRSAMMNAITVAAQSHRADVWPQFPDELAPDAEYDGQGYSAEALGDLFRVSQMYDLQMVARPTLAEHIASVLADPDTPTVIYNALSEAVTDLSSKDAVQNHAAVIGLALEVNAAGEREE